MLPGRYMQALVFVPTCPRALLRPMDPALREVLRIENIEISVDGDVLCRGQRLSLGGLYGVVGLHNRLRASLLSLMTRSAVLDVVNLKFSGDIFFEDIPMEYGELQGMMNPFVMFYSDESVRSSLELANFSDVERLMGVFDLARVQSLPISRLSVSESKAWEAAINVASGARIIVLKDFQSSYESRRRYLSFLRRHAGVHRCVILAELEFPLEHELDGCVLVGRDTLRCVSFSEETGICHYQNLYLELLQMSEDSDDTAREHRWSDMSPKLSSVATGEAEDLESPLQCRIDGFVRFYSEEELGDRTVFEGDVDASSRRVVKGDDAVGLQSGEGCTGPTESGPRYRSNRNTTTIGRIFTRYFYSIDLKSSLILARRKYILKERRLDDLKRFLISLLAQVYVALIMKFKGEIAQGLQDLVFSAPKAVGLLRQMSRNVFSFAADPVPRVLGMLEEGVLCLVCRLLCLALRPAVFFGQKARSFFVLMRSLDWDSADYKVISTGIYFLVFMKGGTIVNEEKAQICSYVNRMYSPGTYFAYIFLYLVLTAWIPILLVSQILGFDFALIFLATGTFVCSLLNLIANMKFKYLCVCVILAFNLLYPLNSEQFQKGFFFKYSESFNFLVTCREFPFVQPAERPVYAYRLLRAFGLIYLFFCYKLSKV